MSDKRQSTAEAMEEFRASALAMGAVMAARIAEVSRALGASVEQMKQNPPKIPSLHNLPKRRPSEGDRS